MKIKSLKPIFVDHLPESLNEGVLYICEEFAIAGHRCCCGCGEEVITPLNRAQWQVQQINGAVSLYPSIGNWKFACKSHYWIKKNQVIDAAPMTKRTIELVNQRDRRDKDLHIQRINKPYIDLASSENDQPRVPYNHSGNWVERAVNWLRKCFDR